MPVRESTTKVRTFRTTRCITELTDFLSGLRAEWAMSQERVDRWREESQLVQEEMRRVLTFLAAKTNDWLQHTSNTPEAISPLDPGRRAYAAKQAYVCSSLAYAFAAHWLLVRQDLGLGQPVSWPAPFLSATPLPTHITIRRHRTKLATRRKEVANKAAASSATQ